nr:hypothetical protein [Tanacetum cinerariifolium]
MTKRHSKEAVMTRMVKVIENDLDAATQIILLEDVQNHQKTRTKERFSEVLGAISVKKMMRRLKKAQEKDKIGSKPEKNEKRGEAGKSQKQLQ